MATTSPDRLHQVYIVSILGKGLLAAIELVAGLALAIVSTSQMSRWVLQLTQGEIVGDPNDLVSSRLHAWALHVSGSDQHFYAWYFVSHGLVKLAVVAALMRGKLWAYPASIVVLALFIAYQVYRYTFAPSPGLIVLTLFDLFVILLILREYRLARREAGQRA